MKNFSPNQNPYPDDEDRFPQTTTNEGYNRRKDRYLANEVDSAAADLDHYLDIYHPRPNKPDPSAFFSLVFYLVPIIGIFPSLWTLYNRDGSREQITISRLSITLMLTWMLGYLLLATGAETSSFAQLRLLILNSFFTSTYFLVSLWLIFRTLQGKTQRVPGVSGLARHIFKK